MGSGALDLLYFILFYFFSFVDLSCLGLDFLMLWEVEIFVAGHRHLVIYST